MSTRKFSKSHKTRLLTTIVVSVFTIIFLLQLVPVAQASVETDFMAVLNSERVILGKTSLAINPSLSTAAYLHSKDMADNNYFSHTSLDGRTFVQRIVAAGYSGYYSLGENIAMAYGSPNAQAAYTMWKNSAGHYANMMGDFNEAGLGIYTARGYTYYTLDLGKRSNPLPPPDPPPQPPPPAADFALAASPSQLNVQAGSAGTAIVTVTSLNGFSGTVALTISAPQGWVVTANPSSLAVSAGASKQAVLYISVSSTASAGTLSITVTGASGSKSHQVTTAVYVAGAPQRLDLAVTTSPSAVSVIRGQTATLTVTVASLGGLSGPVCFSAVVPAGWKFAFNPFSVKLTAGSSGSTTLSLTVPVTALANVYTIKVYGIGNGNSLLRYAVVAVNVQAPQQSQTVPSAPQTLKASAGNGQVTLSWAAPQDNGGSAVTSYRIYRRSAATEEVLLTTVGNVLAYTDSGVTNGQTYVYRVTALNSLGESAKSNEATATPAVPTAGTLNVVVTTDKPTYMRGTFVVVEVTVTDAVSGAALQGTLISIQIVNPNGAPCGSADLKTSSSGTVLAGAGFSSYAPAGTYTVKVTASLAGYQSKTQQTTFAMV